MSFENSIVDDKRNYVYREAYGAPKEYFKQIVALLRDKDLLYPGATACDIGCAAGHFINYLSGQFSGIALTGCDTNPESLALAASRNPSVRFVEGNVENSRLFPIGGFAATFFLGTHQYFDCLEPIIGNLVSWTRPSGRLILFGAFNPDPIDTLVRFRSSDANPASPYLKGWNYPSRASVERVLRKLGKEFVFHRFDLPFDVPPHPEDPVRSWTVVCQGENRRRFTNGIGILADFFVLEVRV
jgi:SAM-dependent methyltransferase